MKILGIIGGMGPLATGDLFKKITLNTKAECDQEHLRVIIDSNSSIPDRTKCIVENGTSPIPQMEVSIKALEGAGAEFLIMPCNTAHYFYDELAKIATVPIINMLDATVEHIYNKYGKDVVVGLLATDGTTQSGIYDTYFNKAGIKLVKPVENQKYVTEFIYEGVKKNNLSIGKVNLYKAVDEMRKQGAKVFVLGCTELSAVTDIYKFGAQFVDPLEIIAKQSILYAGGKINEN